MGAPAGKALTAFRRAVFPLEVARSKAREGSSSTGKLCFKYKIFEKLYGGHVKQLSIVDGIDGCWAWERTHQGIIEFHKKAWR